VGEKSAINRRTLSGRTGWPSGWRENGNPLPYLSAGFVLPPDIFAIHLQPYEMQFVRNAVTSA
jgi:hypothetical protein